MTEIEEKHKLEIENLKSLESSPEIKFKRSSTLNFKNVGAEGTALL
jgi:hypothetical protein